MLTKILPRQRNACYFNGFSCRSVSQPALSPPTATAATPSGGLERIRIRPDKNLNYYLSIFYDKHCRKSRKDILIYLV